MTTPRRRYVSVAIGLIACLLLGGYIASRERKISHDGKIIDFYRYAYDDMAGKEKADPRSPEGDGCEQEEAAFWYGVSLQQRLILCAQPPQPRIHLSAISHAQMRQWFLARLPLPDCTALEALATERPTSEHPADGGSR